MKCTRGEVGNLNSIKILTDRPVVGPRDLFRIAGQGLTANVVRFVVAGLLSGLVMLLPAVMLGFIADEVVPTAFPPCATPTAST